MKNPPNCSKLVVESPLLSLSIPQFSVPQIAAPHSLHGRPMIFFLETLSISSTALFTKVHFASRSVTVTGNCIASSIDSNQATLSAISSKVLFISSTMRRNSPLWPDGSTLTSRFPSFAADDNSPISFITLWTFSMQVINAGISSSCSLRFPIFLRSLSLSVFPIAMSDARVVAASRRVLTWLTFSARTLNSPWYLSSSIIGV